MISNSLIRNSHPVYEKLLWWEQCGADYSGLLKAILTPLTHRGHWKVLVPGVGTGRVVVDLLHTIVQQGIKADVHCVDDDVQYLADFKKRLAEVLEFKVDCDGIWRSDGVSVHIYPMKVEEFFGKYCEDEILENGSYDLMLCLLFFHFIPHCSISVLRRCYALLHHEGVFVVDRLKAPDDHELTLELIPVLDAYAENLVGLGTSEPTSDVDITREVIRQYHLTRLYERSAYYGSAIKGTEIRLLRALLEPIFRIHKSVTCSGVNEVEFRNRGNQPRLPFWWGERKGYELADEGAGGTLMLRPSFECHVYIGKMGSADSELKWEMCERVIQAKAHENLSATLPVTRSDYRFSFDEAHKLVRDTLPLVILQLLVSNGVFDFDSAVTSFFFATGSVHSGMRVPRLDNLHFAIASSEGRTSERILAYRRNFYLFSCVLQRSLSGNFVSAGRPLALLRARVGKAAAFPLNRPYDLLEVPFLSSPIPDDLLEVPERLAPVERQTLWGTLIQLALDAPGADLQRERELLTRILKDSTTDSFRHEVGRFGIAEDQAYVPIALNVLLEEFKHLLFIPLPSFYTQSERGYESKSLLGIGITLERLDERALQEVDRLTALAGSLARRFQDSYIAYRWVSLSRETSVRAALASIVGRNISHNLGSHPLDYLIHSLERDETPEGHIHFLRYVKERMDFLADVTTQWTTMPWYEQSV